MRFNPAAIIVMWNRKGYTPYGMNKDLQSIIKYIDDNTLQTLLVYIYIESHMIGGIHTYY